MSLQPGQQIAHYEILEPLGKGGMGEVYRARDMKLGRDVAIKVLPEELAQDPDRMERFRREAQVLASLNHPNVASIYGVEVFEGGHGLVLELVEGQTLAERLSERPVSVGEAREIALQIAEALEEAHERGIVHRDLKPANVKLTPAGKVKVLDFGLAKTFVDDGTASDDSHSPTLARDATRAGALLGTAPYMSPEQARGQEVDERSDIWSFGCVLWECMTGQSLFGGPTLSDSIGAILHKDPEWARLPDTTPPGMRRLLRRSLAKDPRQRLHHIADARLELEESETPELHSGRSPRSWRLALAALGGALVAGLIGTLWPDSSPATSQLHQGKDNPLASARFSKVAPSQGSESDAAISPDGRFVAFVSNRDGPFDVFVGQIGSGRFRNLTGGEDDPRSPGDDVGFNEDGSEIWLGGGPQRRMRTVPLLGGPARNFLGASVINVEWSPDGERLVFFTKEDGDPVYLAARDGTNIEPLLGSPRGTHQHDPTWSVDGEWIYLVRGRPATLEMNLWRIRPDGSDLEQLTRRKLEVVDPTPLDESTVLYSARDSDGAGPWIWALDVETGISRRASVGLEQFSSLSASADRRRLVATVQEPRAGLWSVPILDRAASESDVVPFGDLPTARALAPRFGGSALFFLSSRGSGDGLWRLQDGEIEEIWRGSETALLNPPAISPDGGSIALLLRRAEEWRLHILSADGAELRELSEAVDARGAASWSPDGQWIVTEGTHAGVRGLFKMPVTGGPPERIADGDALDPIWSPDGNLIVYAGPQVDARSTLLAVRPDGEPVELPEIRVLRNGERIRFLPDGTGLVYMLGSQPSQDFWLLDLGTLEQRRLTQLARVGTMRTFDITPDGRRIVFDRLSRNSDIVLIELPAPDQDP